MAALCALAVWACDGGVPDPEGAVVPPPTLNPVTVEPLVPGSRVVLIGSGFLAPPAGETVVRLVGRIGEAPADFEWPPSAVGASQLRLAVTDDVAARFPAGGGRFDGRVQVTVRAADQPAGQAVEALLGFGLSDAPTPTLAAVTLPAIVAPGARLGVEGDGLIDGSEGRSFLALDGTFTADADGRVDPIADARLPLVQRFDRQTGEVYLRPGALGLAPGRFDGAARLITITPDGTERASGPRRLALTQGPPRVVALTPDPAARGQIIRLRGAGLLPGDPNAETATVVRAEGQFTPAGLPTEAVRFTFVPERWLDHTDVQLAVRSVRGPDGALVGFGARPGRFEGQVQVELFAGQERALSTPVPVRFDIGPPAQFVYLRYLPGFRDGLAQFGLAGAEAELRAQILAVCRRDFAGLRVHFDELPPSDWAEYVTVEIGGPDPNGRDLFGLDNSPGKDTGNLVLNELLGGLNAETVAGGSPGYGGVFIESFFALSPGHPNPVALAEPLFDEVFGPFSPRINPAAVPLPAGGPLDPDRGPALTRAVGALANLVGSTVTHEVGHVLGLAAVPGEWHNPSDTDGGLMDQGLDRPFAERAALDGHPPAQFRGANRAYLQALFGDGGAPAP